MEEKHNKVTFRGDPYDLIELKQLLTGPHQILFDETSDFQNVLLLELKNIRM